MSRWRCRSCWLSLCLRLLRCRMPSSPLRVAASDLGAASMCVLRRQPASSADVDGMWAVHVCKLS
eukprot:2827135-Rhodomonas_salina.1